MDRVNNCLYLVGYVSGTSNIATPGTFRETRSATSSESYLVRLDTSGVRTWEIYLSKTAITDAYAEDAKTDPQGNVYVFGAASGAATTTALSTDCSYKPVPGSTFVDLFVNKFSGVTMEQEIVQLLKRHQQQQNDIERYYKTQT